RRQAKKRGPDVVAAAFDASMPLKSEDNADIEARLARLDRALEELHRLFPRPAQVVQLRFLARFTEEETARELKLSVGTVKRDWTFARAWLATALSDQNST